MLALLAAACADPVEPPAPPPAALPPPAAEGPVWTARVVSVPSATPERFRAPVQTLVAPDGSGETLPLATFAHRLCEGSGGTREEVLAGLRAGGEEARPAWWAALRDVDCGSPGFCAFAESALREEPAAEPLWIVAMECEGASLDALRVERAPAGLVLAAAARRALPWHPRLATLDAELEDPPWEALGRLLAESPAPEAEAALEALRRRAPPAAREALEAPSPLLDLPAAFEGGLDPLAAERRFPRHRGAVGEALEACLASASPASPTTVRSCGRALVRMDRGRARERIPAADDPWGALSGLLLQEPAEARDLLAGLGFEDRSEGPASVPPSTWGELLHDLGHATVLGYVPRLGEAVLAYELADLAGLEGVEFEVVPPSPEAPLVAGREPRPALVAWTGERRARTLLEPGFDDVHTVGLVNALLAERGLEPRVALEASHTAAVVAPPPRLAVLEAQGWIRWAELDPWLLEGGEE